MAFLLDTNIISETIRSKPEHRLMGEGDRRGQAPSAVDAQIAAVALQGELVIVTRNVEDFVGLPMSLLNPWEQGAQ